MDYNFNPNYYHSDDITDKINSSLYNKKKYIKYTTLLYYSIYCNNYEAFTYIINHEKFNSKLINHYDWLEIAIRKYMNNDTKYLDDLIKTKMKIIINYKYLIECTDIEYLKIIMNKFNIEYDIYKLFSCAIDNNRFLLLFEYVLQHSKDRCIGGTFGDYILSVCIQKNDVRILELLKKYNIDLRMCYNRPSILYEYNSYETFKFFVDEGYYYEINLFKYINGINILFRVINNFELISKFFNEVYDDKFEFFNSLLNTFTHSRKYLDFYISNNNMIKDIIKFLKNHPQIYDQNIDLNDWEEKFNIIIKNRMKKKL
jgi:hypothetical protein